MKPDWSTKTATISAGTKVNAFSWWSKLNGYSNVSAWQSLDRVWKFEYLNVHCSLRKKSQWQEDPRCLANLATDTHWEAAFLSSVGIRGRERISHAAAWTGSSAPSRFAVRNIQPGLQLLFQLCIAAGTAHHGYLSRKGKKYPLWRKLHLPLASSLAKVICPLPRSVYSRQNVEHKRWEIPPSNSYVPWLHR